MVMAMVHSDPSDTVITNRKKSFFVARTVREQGKENRHCKKLEKKRMHLTNKG